MKRRGGEVNDLERRKSRTIGVLAILSALSLVALAACSSDERRAERIARDADARLESGDVAGATEQLEEILRRFPDTDAAEDARERLRVVRGLRDAIEKYPSHRTRDAMVQVGRALETHRAARGGYPASLRDLVPDFLPEGVPDDAWGRAFEYEPVRGGAGYRMISRGADGAAGGSGDAEDLVVENGRFQEGAAR